MLKLLSLEERYIFFVTLISCIIWWSTQGIGYTSDSTTYIDLASYLTGQKPFGAYVYFRTVGYPLLMILTGVTLFSSIKILLISQFFMALVIPIIVFRTLSLFLENSKVPSVAAYFLILSLFPFVYSKVIMPDQFFIFVLFYIAYKLAAYFRYEKKNDLFKLILSLVIITLIRPSANLFFILVCIFCFFSIKQHKSIWLFATLMFFTFMSSWSMWVAFHSNPIFNGGISNRLVQSIFYHAYVKEKIHSLQLIELLNKSTKDGSENRVHLKPQKLFKNLEDNPDEYTKALLSHPNIFNYKYIESEIQRHKGSDKKNYMKTIAFESIKSCPSLLISYIRTYMLGAGVSFAGQQLFYHTYVSLPMLHSDKRETFMSIQVKGRHNSKLYSIVKDFINEFPEHWEMREPAEYFKNYAGSPDKLLNDSLINNPTIHSYWFMWNVVDTMLSPVESPSIFMDAALENIMMTTASDHDQRVRDTAVLMFLNNFLYMSFGSTSCCNIGHQQIGLISVRSPEWADPTLNNSYQSQIYKDVISGLKIYKISIKSNDKFYYKLSLVWTVIKIILHTIILAGIIFIFRTNSARYCVLLLLMWGCHSAIGSIFGEPLSRYILQSMPLVIILCSIIIPYVIKFIKTNTTANALGDTVVMQHQE